ncbi:MAG: hypothetical protein U0353_26200 [Sandaracinus sp.]
MKRLTVAYRTGDLAAFKQRRASRSFSILSRIARDRGRAGPPRHPGVAERSRSNAQLDATSAVASETVERYRTVHEFVIRFRDGKMSLADFLKGPSFGPEEDDDSEELAEIAEHLQNGDFVELFELLDELTREATPARGRRRQKRG